jgi:hypothetical protein
MIQTDLISLLKIIQINYSGDQTLSAYLIDTFVGHRNVISALNTIFITYLMLISNTFSINYSEADSDLSNQIKSCDQL